MSTAAHADQNPSTQKLALLLPGSGYPQTAPLLHWTIQILKEADWAVVEATWPPRPSADADPLPMVETVVERLSAGRRPDLIVAKSLGCFAAPWAISHGVPGIWLTPVATDTRVLAALKALAAASLVVAGLADPYWVPGALTESEVRVIESAGADHSMELPAWRDSVALQATLFEAIAEHVTATLS